MKIGIASAVIALVMPVCVFDLDPPFPDSFCILS